MFKSRVAVAVCHVSFRAFEDHVAEKERGNRLPIARQVGLSVVSGGCTKQQIGRGAPELRMALMCGEVQDLGD